MSLSSVDLWQRISAEGLASPMQCRTWAAEAAKTMPPEDAADGLRVLAKLVDLERLSTYQAQILAGKSDRPLRYEGWFVLDEVAGGPFDGWREVTQIDTTKNEQPPAQWACWIDREDLARLKAGSPSLPRAMQLAPLQGPSLQQVAMPELQGTRLRVGVHSCKGKVLAERKKSLSAAEARVAIEHVAEALAVLHRADVVHGRVFPDRIYRSGEQTCLTVDPLCRLPAQPIEAGSNSSNTGLLRDCLPKGTMAAHFLAPEFLAPGQMPTKQTDIYALGCTWWWLLTGKPAVSGETTQKLLAAHAKLQLEIPEELLKPPVAKVLKHAVAANPASRFSDADAFLSALRKADQVVDLGKQAVVAPAVVQAEPVESDVAATVDNVGQGTAESATVNPVQSTPKMAPAKSGSEQADSKSNSSQPLAGDARPAKAASAKKTPAAKKPVKKQPKAAAVKQADKNESSKQPSQATTTSPTTLVQSREAAKPQPAEPVAKDSDSGRKPDGASNPKPADEPAAPQKALAEESEASAPQTVPTAEPKAAAKSTKVQAAPAATPAAIRARRRKKKKNQWMLPVFGGIGGLALLLLVLSLSGALDSNEKEEPAPKPVAAGPGTGGAPTVIEADPRLEFYRIQESTDHLWAPPAGPSPLVLVGLAPGAQCFVSLRPADLLSSVTGRELASSFDPGFSQVLQAIPSLSGVTLEEISQVTVAYYSPEVDGEFPPYMLRVELSNPKSLGQLRSSWGNPGEARVGDTAFLTSDEEHAYFVAQQPLTDAQTVRQFSCGTQTLVRETCELQGAAGPMFSQMERLWEASDSEADFSLLFSAPFLRTDGRALMQKFPKKFQQATKELLGTKVRAGLINSRLEPQWYYEVQLTGASAQESGGISSMLSARVDSLPAAIEQWFVSESPHPYWRALAFRFPQMLKSMRANSRFGVEDGAAIANGYLPSHASTNLLLCSWIALQDGATVASGVMADSGTSVAAPLTVEQYLGRPITISFDQEPIEVALRLVGEEANADLPGGTQPFEFLLDGDAFEKAGITRNQQLSEFAYNNKLVREVLTEIAKKGNPVPGVSDLSIADQKLIWVVRADGDRRSIDLTTRTAATAGSITLPREFSKSE